MAHDYGIPERGASYEQINLALPILEQFPGSFTYDYMQRASVLGRAAMNAECIELVARERPDVTLVTLYTSEFEPATIRELSRWSRTVAYFFDDVWRVRYARSWAPWFDFVATPDPEGPRRYAREAQPNAIWCPFAFNEHVFRRMSLAKEFDVSFVGGWHPYRQWLLEQLGRAGLKVAAFGAGWPEGRVSFEESVRIANASRICLNAWNGATWELPYLVSSPRALRWTLRTDKTTRFVNGRTFELAGCGAFQLMYDAPHLDRYFDLGRDLLSYRGAADLVRTAVRYCAADELRQRIADAGHARAQRDHRATVRLATLVRTVLDGRKRSAD